MRRHTRRLLLFAGSCVALLIGLLTSSAMAGEEDPFDTGYQVQASSPKLDDDPFGTKNELAAPSLPRATKGKEPVARYKSGPVGEVPDNPLLSRIRFSAKLATKAARPGEVVQLIVTGQPLNGNHTYPLTQLEAKQPEKQQSHLKFGGNPALIPLYPVKESEPTRKRQFNGDFWLEHDKEFTWTQDILIDPKAPQGPQALKINIFFEVCNETNCSPPNTPYPPLEVKVQVLGKAVDPPANVAARTKETPVRGGVSGLPSAPEKRSPAEASGLLALLGFAFFGAILMMLTPCVFPMIPITVNFFLKQSEKEHHKPLPTALVYAGTIILLLTLILVAIGHQVIAWAVNPWFNVALGAVMVIFALSLFGMYEIELPQSLARFTSAREGKGGYAGAIFMALTFTITSFTCTGPFLGAMLGGAAALRPQLGHFVLAALVYSATFAAPFFLLALFPSLLKKLPKSGGWLNAIKVSMGFVEMALALKFLANADITWNAGNAVLFNYDTVLCAWIALCGACGLYLMGIFRLPHDDRVESIGVVRMLFAALFIGMAIYLTPALRGEVPLGIVGENLVAFLPPRPVDANSGAGSNGKVAANGKLPWHLDYEKAWQEAVKGREPKRIFIDFTGLTCVNCRKNEDTVFPRQQVRAELEKFVRVQLYTDSVPNRELEDRGDAALNDRRRDAIGDNTNPYYVIFQPDTDAPFDKNGLLKGKVIGAASGVIFDVDKFVQLLQRGLQEAPPVQVASAR